MSKPTKARQRPQLSKAEIKAYEARRAAESRRALVTTEVSAASVGGAVSAARPTRRGYALTRDEEYVIIRADLRRLLFILAVLAVVLFICTLLLR